MKLIIAAPTNCGTSFLMNCLMRCKNAVSLYTYASEGQLLPDAHQYINVNTERYERKDFDVKGFCSLLNAHWQRIYVSYHEIMAEPVFLEKSPGFEVFQALEMEKYDEFSFILMMRDPYAFVEGSKRRSSDCTFRHTRLAINYWIECGYKQIENYAKLESKILITYESMCLCQDQVEEIIQDYTQLHDFTLGHELKIDNILNDKSPHKLMDFNGAQISRLNCTDKSYIKEQLKDHKTMLEFFGYEYD